MRDVVFRPMTRVRAAALITAVLLSASCGAEASTSPSSTILALSGTKRTVDDRSGPSGLSPMSDGTGSPRVQIDMRLFGTADLDSDAAFWASLANPTAYEVERYEAVEDMSSLASVVIIGHVIDVRPTRTIGEAGVEGDDVTYWGIDVEVISVLRGELEPNSCDEVVTVETFALPEGDLPEGASVMFLRHKLDPPPGGSLTGPTPAGEEDKYRLVSSQGLFIDSPEGARNPISDALHGVIADEAGGTRLDPQRDDDEPVDPVAEQVRGMSMDNLIDLITGS